jgi:signal transduction histidine kinase/class 3 adenylate cyclase
LALDKYLDQALLAENVPDLVRLNTYLRRYLSPLVARDLFHQEHLPLLLKQQEFTTITALVLDMRGFVRTTQSGEDASGGLSIVADLLRLFFSGIVRIAFENRGLVGEFAGDRVLITFGFPPPSMIERPTINTSDQMLNALRAINTAFSIQAMITDMKADASFPQSLRQFEVGIGICTDGPAWIGNIGSNQHLSSKDSWRQELTIISKAINIAARAEEMTKDENLMQAAPSKKIIVDKKTIEQLQNHLFQDDYCLKDLKLINVRGLAEKVHLYHFVYLNPDALPVAGFINSEDRLLVDWICKHIDGVIERDIISRVHRSLANTGQIVIANKVLDEEEVLAQIMEQIVNAFNVPKATLYQVEPETGALIVKSSKGPKLPFERLPQGEGIVGQVAQTGQVFTSPDVHNDPRWLGRKMDNTIHSMMCVPLKAGEKTIGVIQIMDNKKGAFRKTDEISLNVFAGLATVALENELIYQRENRMVKARLIITEAFSNAKTLDEVLDAIMVAIEDTLDARNATLYLIDQETGDLIFQKIISESESPPTIGTRLPSGTGIVGQVVVNKTPLLISDTLKNSAWYGKIGSDIRAIICVPLIAKGQAVGAIQVLSQTQNYFDEDHLEVLKWLSASAAVAVENAAQLDQARRKLIASDRFAVVGAIAGKLAHNLKNYVGGIKAIAKFQLKVDDPEAQEKIHTIIQASDDALAEIQSFMQPLSKGLDAANIDLNVTLQQLVEELRRFLQTRYRPAESKANIEIQYLPLAQPLIVYAEEEQIKYIFQNLIDNAIRAIDETAEPVGRIILKTAIETINENKWIVVTIEDTGVGIPSENLERIFRRSFTTRPEGTIGGYGLFWVLINVERAGGRITADSKLGVGSTFIVRLPLVAQPEKV